MFDDDITLELFLSKVEVQPSGCWHWTGTITKGGYGQFHGNNIQMLAHRAGYVLHVGPIPRGAVLDHLCHTNDLNCPGGDGDPHRRCVNWEHLEPVTQQVNVDRGRRAVSDRCGKGHLYTPENTYIDPRGRRSCRTCQKVRSREWLRIHNPGVFHGTETHCPQGHPYDGDNLYIIPSTGGRMCRQCKRDKGRESMRRKRARAKAEAAELAAMEEIAVLLGPAPASELVLF